MAARKLMYVGTEAGVIIMTERGGCWTRERDALKGKFVNMLVAANHAGVVYGCVPNEGVVVSKDAGSSWTLAFAAKVHTLAVDPNNPRAVYAGTDPVGLFRSDDMGDSWTEIEGLQRVPEQVRERWWFPIYPHESHVRSIFVDPRDSRVICIGLEHGGIYRSVDSGENWEDLSAGIEYLDIHMVMADPIQQGLYYAASARGFYRSDQYGRDWIFSTQGVTRDYFHDFVALPGRTSTLLVATANGTPPAWLRPDKAQSAIYRSNDSGLTWQQLSGGLPASMERMIWRIVRDPQDDGGVYAGAGDYTLNLSKSEIGYGEVWASTDRGDHWNQIHEGSSPVRSLCVGLQ
jgi:photosystem II stability/assembly factor-like uncharacterized protein